MRNTVGSWRGAITLLAAALTAGLILPGNAFAQAPASAKATYVVLLDNKALAARTVRQLVAPSQVQRVYPTVNGFSATMTATAAQRLRSNPAVARVEVNSRYTASGIQTNPPSWGLDRIDERQLPLDKKYDYSNTASGLNVYVLDSGVRRSHSDFGGRVTSGYDFIDNDTNADDCNGHGTHVAGTLGGKRFGVAKAVKIVSVRVLDCESNGTLAGAIAGIDWVIAHKGRGTVVANMSLGGAHSEILNAAVKLATSRGVVMVVAAGNGSDDACQYSPASTPTAVTVGATTRTDARAHYSNYGKCVDIFAPGTEITSAWPDSTNKAIETLNGTSMATPHVAGVAAQLLKSHPSWTVAQVTSKLMSLSTKGKVQNAGVGSPNRLLYLC